MVILYLIPVTHVVFYLILYNTFRDISADHPLNQQPIISAFERIYAEKYQLFFMFNFKFHSNTRQETCSLEGKLPPRRDDRILSHFN